MRKLKTHKGVKRRIKVTGTGKLLHMRAGRRHLLTGKSSRRMRKLRRQTEVPASQQAALRALLA